MEFDQVRRFCSTKHGGFETLLAVPIHHEAKEYFPADSISVRSLPSQSSRFRNHPVCQNYK